MAHAKAAILAKPRTFELTSLPLPDELPAGVSLIRIEANGICGSDYDAYVGRFGFEPPYVPGHEAVGVVEALAPESAALWGVAEGDRVAVSSWAQCGQCPECRRGLGKHCRLYSPLTARKFMGQEDGPQLRGGLAEYMLVNSFSPLLPVPPELGAEDCVLFNPMANGFEWTLKCGGVGVGDRVLVMGAGQRGLACVIAANEAGATQIIVTGLTRDSHKFELARQYGATDVIDVEREDLLETVRRQTDGELVDVAIDLVPGDPSTLADAVEAVRPGGVVVLAGVKGRNIKDLATDRIWRKSLKLRGAVGFSSTSVELALSTIGSGKYDWDPIHSHTFSLSEVDLAVRVLGGEVADESPIHVTVIP